MAGEQSDLSLAKDWIYVFCTVLTLLLSLFTFLCCERRNRIRDRKEAERKAKEEKQKVDTEKILALLNNDFVKVVENYRDLKKRVDRLKKNTIDTGSRTFTEFDVLLYMCHEDNWHLFNVESRFGAQLNFTTDVHRENVVNDVDEIFAFFRAFAFQLSVIDEPCPANFKLEFSAEIIAMGQTIYPFMTEAEQKHIRKVVTYFGYTEPDTPCILWRQRQATCDPETQTLGINEMAMQPNANQQLQRTNEGLKAYPGHNAIKTAIPYIKYFRYMGYNRMNCHISWSDAYTGGIASRVVNGEIIQSVKVGISNSIKLWFNFSGDVLHQLRMLMFKTTTDRTFLFREQLRQFREEIMPFSHPTYHYVVDNCKRHLHEIMKHVKKLLNTSQKAHKSLRHGSTLIFLKQYEGELGRFTELKSDNISLESRDCIEQELVKFTEQELRRHTYLKFHYALLRPDQKCRRFSF